MDFHKEITVMEIGKYHSLEPFTNFLGVFFI